MSSQLLTAAHCGSLSSFFPDWEVDYFVCVCVCVCVCVHSTPWVEFLRSARCQGHIMTNSDGESTGGQATSDMSPSLLNTWVELLRSTSGSKHRDAGSEWRQGVSEGEDCDVSGGALGGPALLILSVSRANWADGFQFPSPRADAFD